MAANTQHQHPQHAQHSPTATGTTPEEEFLKRNTDCVYFLASPLTCKKGSECEYRHSDIARVNPRDCWFWLNGNCLNPKCGFRHPPLDGLLGAEAPSSVVPPLSQATTTSSAKQGVPCIFFQKGFCLRGDRCPFLHAPKSINSNKASQLIVPTQVSEPHALERVVGGPEPEHDRSQEKVQQVTAAKPVELLPPVKPISREEAALQSRNGIVIDKIAPAPSSLAEELPSYRASNEMLTRRSNQNYQSHLSDSDSIPNGKDTDEFSREPSPGFDVLVDDELRDSGYYHSEEQFDQSADYDIGRTIDYNSMVDVDRNTHRDYNSYEAQKGRYAREDHILSSDRIPRGSDFSDRIRSHSPDQIDELDLRHLISKQRRGNNNGLRSVVSRDSRGEDRSYRDCRRDKGSLSSRLRGRIRIPGKSASPVDDNELLVWREKETERQRAKFSPARPRVRDRMKGKFQEGFYNEGRDFRGSHDNYRNEFVGPKSLTELKTGKNADDPQFSGKRKYQGADNRPQIEDDLSFEGPKPLSEILKRKRGESTVSGKEGDYNQKERKENLLKSTVATDKEECNANTGDLDEERKGGGLVIGAQSSHLPQEVGTDIGEEAMERNDKREAFDQQDGEYDYEHEDLVLKEGKNVEPEEEYLDEDDDGDDFAKKMGIEFS